VSFGRLLPISSENSIRLVWKPRAEVRSRLGRCGSVRLGFCSPHSNCTELLKAPWKPIGAINPLCFQFLFYCSPQASVCACLARSVCEFESLWQGEHQNTETPKHRNPETPNPTNSAIFGEWLSGRKGARNYSTLSGTKHKCTK